ncbi:NAD(P)H-hydrate dehydratase [Dehalogenimonas sp. 4OHTPN]|uniref:Bifunctional NAD(P)H-hydrate repair enzyme n=1 Tax=Dehalogenimonas sp. 4OHTPN TaxID=3166643 RepID=A0AAU8G996_9CHLR
MKLVTAAEMRRLEQEAAAGGVSAAELMQRAGREAADKIAALFEPAAGKRVVVLVGPGNNGGDGLVAARHLKTAGVLTDIYLLSPRGSDDIVLREAVTAGLSPLEARYDVGFERLRAALEEADVVLDAVFGTGLGRSISGAPAAALALVAEACARRPEITVVALDLPSGLDADTGAIDPSAVRADFTITLGYAKRGFFLFPGAGYTGEVLVADIGLPEESGAALNTEVLDEHLILDLLPDRPADAHKGTFGKVLVAAGSPEYAGAAVLACQAAGRAGAGLVTLAAGKSLYPVLASRLTETTHLILPQTADGGLAPGAEELIAGRLKEFPAAVIGPGLGQSLSAAAFTRALLAALSRPENRALRFAAVLDADALNILSLESEWWQKVDFPAVLTPHPGEMARLAGLAAARVQSDRIELARRCAGLWRQVVVLKGAHTVIASPDGRVAVAPNANPALATAGTGDVLTGIIGGLLAQGLAPFDAARAGVYIHAMAAESVRAALGDCGAVASDLLPHIPRSFKALKEHDHAACH